MKERVAVQKKKKEITERKVWGVPLAYRRNPYLGVPGVSRVSPEKTEGKERKAEVKTEC